MGSTARRSPTAHRAPAVGPVVPPRPDNTAQLTDHPRETSSKDTEPVLRKLIIGDLERLVQQQAALDRSAARLTPGSRPGGEGGGGTGYGPGGQQVGRGRCGNRAVV